MFTAAQRCDDRRTLRCTTVPAFAERLLGLDGSRILDVTEMPMRS